MLTIKADNYSDYFPKYKKNAQAATKLMDTLNLAGCFSDELIKKFWYVIHYALEVRISNKEHDFKKDIQDFHDIYEPYCIFSDTFKHHINTLFLTVLTQPSGKKK